MNKIFYFYRLDKPPKDIKMVKKSQKKTGDQRRLLREKAEQDFNNLLSQVKDFVSYRICSRLVFYMLK